MSKVVYVLVRLVVCLSLNIASGIRVVGTATNLASKMGRSSIQTDSKVFHSNGTISVRSIGGGEVH